MPLVTYRLDGPVATIAMDDGKVNALSTAMLGEVRAALDRAVADGAVTVLAGRENRFSAGFDLGVLQAGGEAALTMLRSGFELAERMLAHPLPVVVACTGHAVAMGSFLLLAGDVRVGADGPFRITANEVALGITMPHAAVELCRGRLAPAQLQRAVLLAEVFSPEAAVAAGFLDRVVPPGDVLEVATGLARDLAALDMRAHAESKLRLRGPMLSALRAAIEADDAGLRGAV